MPAAATHSPQRSLVKKHAAVWLQMLGTWCLGWLPSGVAGAATTAVNLHVSMPVYMLPRGTADAVPARLGFCQGLLLSALLFV